MLVRAGRKNSVTKYNIHILLYKCCCYSCVNLILVRLKYYDTRYAAMQLDIQTDQVLLHTSPKLCK